MSKVRGIEFLLRLDDIKDLRAFGQKSCVGHFLINMNQRYKRIHLFIVVSIKFSFSIFYVDDWNEIQFRRMCVGWK